jgi:hypothetical protein
MGRATSFSDVTAGRRSATDCGSPGDSLTVGKRQAAAAYLDAARLTDDAAERQVLRRKAVTLLAARATAARATAACGRC